MFTWFGYNVLLNIFIYSSACFATLYEGEKCSLNDGSEGTCKLITECPTATQLLRTGNYPIICGHTQYIICCKDGANTTQTTSTTTTIAPIPQPLKITDTTQVPTQVTVTSRTPGDISKQKCKEYSQYAYERFMSPTLSMIPYFVKSLECDLHKVTLVLENNVASRREFPHMALIGYKMDDEVSWQCEGTLISENFVLTAGHCLFLVYWGQPALVRVGFTNKMDLTYMQERTVSEIIPHPNYSHTRYHDIGLLRLSKNIEFNIYARPACLYTEKTISNENAIATGWGCDFNEEANDLLKVVLKLFSAEKYHIYKKFSPSGLKDGIVNNLICAGSFDGPQPKNTSCKGDSGESLQICHSESEEDIWYNIIGLISFETSCSLVKKQPEVNIRLSTYIKWIE